MNDTPFQSFITLIDFDQSLLKNEQDIKVLQQEIVQVKKQEEQMDSRLESAKTRAHNTRKEVDRIELELKEFDAAEKTKKERLENIGDYKLYQALKNEIETLKQKQVDAESTLLEAWNSLENAQKDAELVKQEHAQKMDEYKKSIEEKKQAINELETKISQLKLQRVEIEKPVPPEWLEKYSIMRARVSDPVVPVQRGACSACFYTVNEQDLLHVRRRKMLQCKGCFRLLYSSEHEQKAEQSS